MKNIQDVLKDKEQELRMVQRQVEALNIVLPLLVESTDTAPEAPKGDTVMVNGVPRPIRRFP